MARKPSQSSAAQKPLKRVPGSQAPMYPSNKNFTFNPSGDNAAHVLPTQPWDNGINVVKGPPVADIAIPPINPTLEDVLQEWGSTGTIIVGGILSNVDYNQELTGTQRVKIYDQMRLGDATVRAALLAVKLPILAAQWYIKPFKENDKQSEQVKDFIEEQLFNTMDITWTDWLRHCMNYLDYGSMLFEKIYKIMPDGSIGWKKFAPRLTKTIYRWRMPDNVTEGVTQIIPTGGLRGIPMWKCLLFVNEQEGEDYEGISLLRPAYKHWYIKDGLYKIDSVASERQGLGIPYVKVPPNASDRDRAAIDDILRNMRTNESANVQIPVGWEIGFLDMHAPQTKGVKDMVMHHDRQISKSVLAQFLELGSSQTGSFALSSNQSELFLLSLKAVAQKIQETVNVGGIRELVDLNFNVNNQYPTLEYGRIGQVDFEKLSMALFRLAQGGLITASPELETYLANAMELPEPDQNSVSNQEDMDNEDITLPVPVVQKKTFPVKVYSKEKMDKIESKYASEMKEMSRELGMDVREMRREIADILKGRTR